MCSPIKYQGLSVPYLYTSQFIAHVERILECRHINDSNIGHESSIEQLKLQRINIILRKIRWVSLEGLEYW
jgi:hypothetical protein